MDVEGSVLMPVVCDFCKRKLGSSKVYIVLSGVNLDSDPQQSYKMSLDSDDEQHCTEYGVHEPDCALKAALEAASMLGG